MTSRHAVFCSSIRLVKRMFMLLSILIVHINAPFLDISGCARQYEQALLHSLARKLAAARHNPSKLGFCSRLAQTFDFWIFQTVLLRYLNDKNDDYEKANSLFRHGQCAGGFSKRDWRHADQVARLLVYSFIIKQTIRTSRCIGYRYLILWQKRLRPTKECPS